MVNFANQAADELKREGVGVTVIDPRTTSPLDTETILDSVAETGRLVVVDEVHPRCSMAADIARLVAEEAFGHLKAPIKTVTAPHTPVPFSPALEDIYIPSPKKIRDAVLAVTRGRSSMSEIQPIVMPKWGLAMEEGTLTAWLVQDGSQIEKGQEIAEIETTKIANVFESPALGNPSPHGREAGRCAAGRRAARGAGAAVRSPTADIDGFVAGFVVEASTDADAAAGASPNVGWNETVGLWSTRRRACKTTRRRSCSSMASAAIPTIGSSTSTRLAKYRPVYALDLPGHGKSTKTLASGDLGELARRGRRSA